jgi:hypothetical protein
VLHNFLNKGREDFDFTHIDNLTNMEEDGGKNSEANNIGIMEG